MWRVTATMSTAHTGRGSGVQLAALCYRASRRSRTRRRSCSFAPGRHRALFDELVAEARYGHRQREDIRGLCWNWPCGLVRRGLLEAGRRLRAAGNVHEVAHVVELFPDELDRVLLGQVQRGADGPSADKLAERAVERDRIEATPPPRLLGEPEAPPPLDALPKAMARATAAIMANLSADATPPPKDDETSTVSGIGIGDTTADPAVAIDYD